MVLDKFTTIIWTGIEVQFELIDIDMICTCSNLGYIAPAKLSIAFYYHEVF